MRKFAVICFVAVIFLSLYARFWIIVFNKQQSNRAIEDFLIKKKILSQHIVPTPSKKAEAVLGEKVTTLPASYTLSIVPRKQVFNLSCEFAAAAAVIYHYNNNELFATQNELAAERTLIAKIPASQNPNIGVRMGNTASESAELLYQNLNQRFGGTDYYGVHTPPFIDVFWDYKLLARPIKKGDINAIKKAIFSGHLVMTWIRVGYGKAVDVALSYGTAPVIKGEHAVVIYGYNQDGVNIMDPGIGQNRFISYQTLLDATSLFPLPFLEVHPSTTGPAYNPTAGTDRLTGLNRGIVKIVVRKTSDEIGAGNTMAEILKDFGYKVLRIEKVVDNEPNGVTITLIPELSDYKNLLQQDLLLAGYSISSISATLSTSGEENTVVVVGE